MFINRNTQQCGNCHAWFTNDDEKYCAYCGAKRGEERWEHCDGPAYDPAPEQKTRECVKCGYQWTYKDVIDSRRYCVRCGGESALIHDDAARLYLNDEAIEPARMRVREVDAVRSVCCDKLISAAYKFCPFCGKSLDNNRKIAQERYLMDMDETVWLCKCGQGVPLRYRHCGHCGSRR